MRICGFSRRKRASVFSGQIIAAAAVAGLTSSSAFAVFTFDGNLGTPSVQDGSGTWNLSNVNWWDSGTSADVVWPNNTAAVFGAGVDGTYAITVGETMNASAITFQNSGYTLSAASAVTINTVASVSVASGKTATIGQNVSVTRGSNIALSGAGTLNISGTGATVFTGASFQAITITNGTVDVQTGGSLYTNHQDNAALSVNSGTLKVTGGTVQVRNAHSNNGAAAVNMNVGSGAGNTGTLQLDSGSVEIYRTSRTTANVAERVSGNLVVGQNASSTGILNLNGGTLIVPNTRFAGGTGNDGPGTNGAIILTAGNSASATMNLNGTAAMVGPTSVRGLRFFGNDSQTGATATVNLTGGTLTVPVITTYAAQGAGTTGTFNFNGGTLKANASNASYFGATGANLLDVTAVVKSGGAKIDTNTFNIGIGQALTHDASLGGSFDGGLTKSSTGILTLSGANTYIGDTTINGGTLALSDGSLVFDINNTTSTKFLGTGGLSLDGTLRLDIADFSAPTGTWQLVATALSETYGSNFAVAFKGSPDVAFTQAADVWSGTDGLGRTWTFTEETGILAVPEPGSLVLAGSIGLLALRRRRVS